MAAQSGHVIELVALAVITVGLACGAASAQSSMAEADVGAVTAPGPDTVSGPSPSGPTDDADTGDSAATATAIDDAALSRAIGGGNDDLDSLKKMGRWQPPKSFDTDKTFHWSKSDNADGSTSYSVNHPLPAPWASSFGADISVAPSANPAAAIDPNRSTVAGGPGSGSAYANVMVPDIAKVELRAEPANDHGRVSASLQRSIPLGKSFSLAMQGSVGFTEAIRTPGASDPVVTGTTTPAGIVDTDQSVQFNVLSTGTSLLAGTSTFTGDPMVHNRVGATQKIYGPLSVTGTFNDVGEATASKSISAGLNFAW